MMTSPTQVTGRLADLSGLTPIAEANAYYDPQVVYTRLRAEWGEVAPVELQPGINAWLVMGYEELVNVLKQERLFSMSPHNWRDFAEGRVKPDSPLGPMMFPRPNAWFSDGDEHRRLRAPIDAAVNGLRMRQTSQQVKEVCDSLISGFTARGHADLLSEYALMIPTLAVARMAGLDLGLAYEMHQAQMDLFTSGEKAQAGDKRFTEILVDLVAARKAEPGPDLTSAIVRHPNLTNDSERIQAMVLIIAAAAETTMAWIGSSLQLMLADRRFSGRMRGGRLDVDDALDEVLWREPPMSNLPARFALRDTELAGQPISQGDALILGFAPAHADPRIQGDDQWSGLGNRSHLAWSAGPHVCPAHVPGRIIVRTAVEAVLYQLPDVRLTVPAEELGRLESLWTRCPATLPVKFTPVPATA
jgi:cytochrome P450